MSLINGFEGRGKPLGDMRPVTQSEGSRTRLPSTLEGVFCVGCGEPADLGIGSPPIDVCFNCFSFNLTHIRHVLDQAAVG